MSRRTSPLFLLVFAAAAVCFLWFFNLIAATAVSDFITRHLASAFGMDAAKMIAAFSEFAMPILCGGVFVYAAYWLGVRERETRPSELDILFNVSLSGCRVETSFAGTVPLQRAAVYRLLVRPPKGQIRKEVSARLVDIMVQKDLETLYSL